MPRTDREAIYKRDWLTKPQAQKRAGVGDQVLDILISQGAIRAYRFPGRKTIRLYWPEVDAALRGDPLPLDQPPATPASPAPSDSDDDGDDR